MIIVGVRLNKLGKIHYFDPRNIYLKKGDRVIVDTARWAESGEVVIIKNISERAKNKYVIDRIRRKINKNDFHRLESNKEKEKIAFEVCKKKIAKRRLKMTLIDVEYSFNGKKAIFYFTSEGRVDFRVLVKDLSSVFKAKIELKQVGIRDEARILGGLGICGRIFCCNAYLNGFETVSIKMAKEQGVSLTPSKVVGACGRLMCCLKYEQDTYENLLKTTPKVGDIIATIEGEGTVVECNLLSQKIKVKLRKFEDQPPKEFKVREVRII